MTDGFQHVRFRAVVTGRVQGVCFRAHTRDYARANGLLGYVRNCADGTVEVEATGEPSVLDEFLQWLHHGPPSARVSKVDTTWLADGKPFNDFSVRAGGGAWW